MDALHVVPPQSHEVEGTLESAGDTGEFHEWAQGDSQRRDERLGLRVERVLRVGDRLWIQNPAGEVREVRGILARRQITQDFISSETFVHHPESLRLLHATRLPDGREVYEIEVTPPSGETYTIGIDTTTWLIDEQSYIDHDAPQTSYYSDFRVVDGLLVAYTELDSNGDRAYDLTSRVTRVVVDKPIDPVVFAPLRRFEIQADQPVTLPFDVVDGHPFLQVELGGKTYRFLVDTGSQTDVIDTTVAADLRLRPAGSFEVSGAARTAAQGIVMLPEMSFGAARLGPHPATVLDLSHVLRDGKPLGGVLGFPFFGAAEVRFDPDRLVITIARPGALDVDSSRIEVDTDRELAEVDGRVERAQTRLVLDTGNNEELLLFQNFVSAHPGLVETMNGQYQHNTGVGGSMASVRTMVGELSIGQQRLYNRYTDVIFANRGAFADRNDGGNVGWGTLENFVATFDLADRALYLKPARAFDDGRGRPVAGGHILDTTSPPRGHRSGALSLHDDAADRFQHSLGAARGDRSTFALAGVVFRVARIASGGFTGDGAAASPRLRRRGARAGQHAGHRACGAISTR
jgi:hypothetical protein